jgi:glutaminyl-tRNA synthetase
MVVLKPLKVVVVNLKEGEVEELDAKIWPDDREGSYKVPFTKVLYIESSDFRLKDAKDYYGLAPGKSVLLRWAYPVKCSNVVLADDKETVLEVHVEYDRSKSTKPKGVIHWVAEPSPGVEPLKVEVRLFDKLFRSENPAELDDWLADLNPNSREVITDAYAVPPLKHAKEGDRFQFERLGYFCVDRDSSEQKVVFNRTVTLRDSYKPGSK